MQPKVILLAEDNPDDALIFGLMCKRSTLHHTIHIVEDGQQAIDWLTGNGKYEDRKVYPLPDILLLDLKMPVKNGLEVLEWVRAQKEFDDLPTVILTSSNLPADMQRARDLGVTQYFVKSAKLQDIIQYLQAAA